MTYRYDDCNMFLYILLKFVSGISKLTWTYLVRLCLRIVKSVTLIINIFKMDSTNFKISCFKKSINNLYFQSLACVKSFWKIIHFTS